MVCRPKNFMQFINQNSLNISSILTGVAAILSPEQISSWSNYIFQEYSRLFNSTFTDPCWSSWILWPKRSRQIYMLRTNYTNVTPAFLWVYGICRPFCPQEASIQRSWEWCSLRWTRHNRCTFYQCALVLVWCPWIGISLLRQKRYNFCNQVCMLSLEQKPRLPIECHFYLF